MKNTSEAKVEEDNEESLQQEELDKIGITKKYSLKVILKTSSCVLSKEKNYIWKNFFNNYIC